MLFGRADEQARVERLVACARSGAGGVLVVRGEPGVGKSALLGLAGRSAPGMQVLAARAVEGEADLPYATLSQLLRPILAHRERLPPHQRSALEGAFGLAAPLTEDRFGVYVATLALLAEAAERSPLLVVVDDAHWLDSASARSLSFVARRLGADPIALLIAARSGQRPVFDPSDLPELPVAGLDACAAAALLQSHVRGPVDPSVAERVHLATAGNPLALIELTGLLSEDELAGRERLRDPLPVGRSIHRALRERIEALPPRTRRALVVAAAGESREVEAIAAALRAAGLDEADLEPAEIAGVVDIAARRLDFRHPLLRSTAYHSACASQQRAAHRAHAEALVGRAPGTRAWHLAAASLAPEEEVAAEIERAARDSRARAAPTAAARAFVEAARLTPHPAERCRRLIEAARDFQAAGDPQRAVTLLEEELSREPEPCLRADVQHVRARVELMRGSPVAIHDLLLREAFRVEPEDPVLATAMLVDAGFVSIMCGRPRESLRLGRQALPRAEQVGGPLRLAACFLLGSALILSGQRRSGHALLVEAEPLVDLPAMRAEPFVTAAIGHHQLWAEEHVHGRELLERVVTRARVEGPVSALPYALAALAEAEFRLGNWAVAYATASQSVALAEEVGQLSELAHSLVRLAAVEAGQGREDDCRTHVRRALEIADALGIDSIGVLAGWVLGLLELGLGRYREAIEGLEATGRLALDAGLYEPSVAPWAADLAEACVRDGGAERAEAVVADLHAQARAAHSRGALAAAARCAGLLGGDAEFEQHFLRAVRLHDEIEAPFERARTELCFGERLRRAGRRVDARERLAAAVRTFDRLGATPWAERGRRELAATGERVRARSSARRDQLTAQELQVALAIAEGKTNREAAAALFVSPKTIETHLSHIYRKLAIRSRSELVRLILDPAAEREKGGAV
jgi:DNA-binding CsgD family transcriptional regulator